jgi:hypothetical protein
MKLTTHHAVLVGIITIAAFSSSATAQVIAIDFNDGGATDQSPGSTAVVGPYATAGWNNNVDVSTNPGPGSINLTDSAGLPTTATFGFTLYPNYTLQGLAIYSPSFPATGNADGTLTVDQQLYNGAATTGAFQNAAGQEVVLQNIPYAQYSVYVLVNSMNFNDIAEVQNFNGGTVDGAGTAFYVANTDPGVTSGTFPGYIQGTSTSPYDPTAGGDYVVFTGLTSADQTIDLQDWVAQNGGLPYDGGAAISGIEIVDTSSSAVPEPSTYAMMFAGLALLGVHLRRRRA